MDLLSEYFYSKEFGAGGLEQFIQYLRSKKVNIKRKDVKEWYDKQENKQILKMPKQRTEFNPIFTLDGHSQILYMDSMFFLKKNKKGINQKIGVIVAIDLFSKYIFLYIKLLKLSYGGIAKGTGVKVEDTEKFLQTIPKYKKIRTDGGSEFFFKKQEYKNIHETFVDNTHRLLSPVERANYSVRLLYENYILNNPDEYNIETIFTDISNTYNNHRIHDSTNLTPKEGMLDSNHDYILQRIFKFTKFQKPVFNKGDRVRLLIKRDPFNKLKSRWTRDIFIIDVYDEELKRYTFPHTKRKYDIDEIQLIPNDTIHRENPTIQTPNNANNANTKSGTILPFLSKKTKPPPSQRPKRVREPLEIFTYI